MRPNESLSVEMLHSVGALMDTSFLRAAVADAVGTPHAGAAPASSLASALAWAKAAVSLLLKAAR